MERIRTIPRPSWPLVLLFLGLACIGLALGEAARTARSNRLVAERAVAGYSAFAAWSYREHLTETLRNMALEALGAVNHGNAPHTGAAIPDASDLSHYLPWDPSCNCHVARKGPLPDAFLGFSLGGDTLAISPSYEGKGVLSGMVTDTLMHRAMVRPVAKVSPAEERFILDTLTRLARAPRPIQGYNVTFHRVADSVQMIISTVMPTSRGDTVIYASLYTRTVTDSILAAVLDAPGLLPQGLGTLGPNRAIVSMAIDDAAMQPLFASEHPVVEYASRPMSENLPASYGGLRIRLQFRPELANKIVIGGLPSSRLPLLLALLALAAGLTVIAMVQMRRESRFAHERSAFVANVSHELRTPLTQIRLVTDTLRLGRESDPVRRDAALALVDREVSRLQHLVESVLRFSRGESRTTEPRTTMEVASEVQRIVKDFAPLATPRGMNIRVVAPAILEAQLRGNALRQVLLNLLDNAVKYGPDGQTIEVAVESLPGAGVRLRVRDEGPGVPLDERERIWHPYQRGSAAAGRAAGGSGIGLTVVEDIARHHGGAVAVGGDTHGAEFVVTFAGRDA
jgi:signal transduction histidine kinase